MYEIPPFFFAHIVLPDPNGTWKLWLDVHKIFYLRYKNCVAHELRIKKAAEYFAISFNGTKFFFKIVWR